MAGNQSERREKFLAKTIGKLFALFKKLFRHNATERVEKLFVLGDLVFPIFVIDLEQFVDTLVIDFELGKIEIVNSRQPADGGLHSSPAALATIKDPLQHPHVIAETRPKKLAFRAFSKPILTT